MNRVCLPLSPTVIHCICGFALLSSSDNIEHSSWLTKWQTIAADKPNQAGWLLRQENASV